MHPCLSCGACCAAYRVAFHWLETAGEGASAVPARLTQPLDAHRLVMQGTRDHPVRCRALAGVVGHNARCTIYPQRPSVCRAVEAAWEHGRASPQCDRARARHGLARLTPRDWRARSRAQARALAESTRPITLLWPIDSAYASARPSSADADVRTPADNGW